MAAVRYALLAAGLLAASWTDWKRRRIPNRLSVTMAAAGVLLGLVTGGLSVLLGSLGGLAAGLTVGVILWLLKTFRAGDAKLLAALGAMMGWRWLVACFLSDYTGCCPDVLGGSLFFAPSFFPKLPKIPHLLSQVRFFYIAAIFNRTPGCSSERPPGYP
ncbi:A24 family peptidase [Dysosmobacter sp.]|uniref:A24 family peptidase n=1 Tax=Dysosmobacter sp. TaxID=2591382 RepID=UPI002A9C03D5|nr:A24 family peptidase [Dysosmobacter sp.]MDY5611918.1 A24 family peptidase [Dysosmobacter sp.]